MDAMSARLSEEIWLEILQQFVGEPRQRWWTIAAPEEILALMLVSKQWLVRRFPSSSEPPRLTRSYSASLSLYYTDTCASLSAFPWASFSRRSTCTRHGAKIVHAGCELYTSA
jgi:hypothetical protein